TGDRANSATKTSGSRFTGGSSSRRGEQRCYPPGDFSCMRFAPTRITSRLKALGNLCTAGRHRHIYWYAGLWPSTLRKAFARLAGGRDRAATRPLLRSVNHAGGATGDGGCTGGRRAGASGRPQTHTRGAEVPGGATKA